MKLLCVSDCHPRTDLAVLASTEKAEAVLTLGDLGFGELKTLRDLRLPKLGVYGNHCSPYMEQLGITNMHLRKAMARNGLVFAGFEGCVRYKPSGAYQYTQAEAFEMVRRMPPCDVLMTHCPPAGINDDPNDPVHVGYDALVYYIERHPPKLIVHGHTMPLEPIKEWNGIRVEWIYGAQIVEI